jgi:STE24 endopeptidase
LNVYGLIVLIALIVDYLLGFVSDWLNLRALSTDVPQALSGLYSPEEYRRSQEYTRVATRFGLVSSTYMLAIVLTFWFGGGFNIVDGVVRGWGFAPVVAGVLYIGIIMSARSLVSLPFSIYHTFGIEQRFGFNRTTPVLFVKDLLKGLALAVVLGMPLLAAVMALFLYGGQMAWVYVWLAVLAVTLAIQYVAPVWLMPLFNKFTPMPEGDLRTAIMEYTKANHFPVSNLFVVDSSRRSTRANAFFTGFGRNKRIALFDTLVQQHTVPEIVAVLAHEIGHYKKKHVLQGMVLGMVHSAVMLLVLSLVLDSPGLYQAFYMEHSSVYAGLIFFGLLYTPVELVLSVASGAISRHNERQADRYAVMTTHDAGSVAGALKKLSRNNLSNLTPHPFHVFLTYSHPPLLERVRDIEAEGGAGKSPVKRL